MQFSIRRPKLPSSETHPEESMYKRLDVAAWLRHLNELGQVEEGYKLRKVSRGHPGPPPRRGGVGCQPLAREEAPCEPADKAIKGSALKSKPPERVWGTRRQPA